MDVLEILMQSYTSKVRWCGGIFPKSHDHDHGKATLCLLSAILFYFSRKEGEAHMDWGFLETAPAPVFSFCPPWVALRALLWSAYCVLGPIMCIIS